MLEKVQRKGEEEVRVSSEQLYPCARCWGPQQLMESA